jgi:hypothetical protein
MGLELELLRVMLGSLCLGLAVGCVYLALSFTLERPLAELRHRLAHRLGRQTGTTVSWTARDGRLMVGFFCDGCARVTGVHAMPDYLQDPAARSSR